MPLDIENVDPMLEQPPPTVFEKTTALPDPPPVAATPKFVPKVAVPGAWVVITMVCGACAIVSVTVPLALL